MLFRSPNKALGDVNPTQPAPPKKPGGCGVVGQIIMVVIAIAVTAFVLGPMVAGAANFFAGAGLGTTVGASVSGAAATAIPGTVVAGAGIAAGSAAGIAGAIVGGAITGAMASIVSQAFGVATGIQDKFDWKAVGISAISGGINGGIGVGPLADISGMTGAAIRGAVSSAATQGIAVATGLQEKFSWSQVAVSAVMAGVSEGVGNLIGLPDDASTWGLKDYGKAAAVTTASVVAGASAMSIIDGTSFGDNVVALIPQAIGQTVGQMLVGAVQAAAAKQRHEDNLRFVSELSAAQEYNPEEILAAAGALNELDDIAAYLGGVTEQERVRTAIAESPEAQHALLGLGRSKVDRASASVVSGHATTLIRHIANEETAQQTGSALSMIPDISDTYIVGDLNSGSRESVLQQYIGYVADALEGTGRAVDYVSDKIHKNRFLHYTLMAIDAASGPVTFAVNALVAMSPVGHAIERGVERASEFFVDQVAKVVGRENIEKAYYITTGTIFLATAAAGVRQGLRYFRTVSQHLQGKGMCFVAGTPVLTPDGLKTIEDLAVGDLVVARCDVTGATEPKAIVQLIRNTGLEVWSVVVEADGHRETIKATAEHPWRTLGSDIIEQWTPTSELAEGVLIARENGQPARIVSVQTDGEVADTFNFEVQGFHTYFVGESSLWVHNACPGARPPSFTPEGAGRSGAFRQAKRDAGIPMGQQPARVLPNLDRNGRVVRNPDGTPQRGRIYEYEIRDASGRLLRTIRILEHAEGHRFPDNPTQDRGPHFNGPDPDNNHYDY